MKGEYSKMDFSRSARLHKVPYRHPEKFPIGTVAAMRAFYWVNDRDPARARALAKALYGAYFVEGRDISAPATVVEIAKSVGVDSAALAAALEDPTVKERAKKEVEAAIAAGVFGSPFFVVDGEPFWGVDRLPMVEDWIRTGGW
jgi:2-hydroxychromene-2-carboxylate isomerase